MMNIQKATREFEQWLTQYTTLVQADLTFKHEQMKVGAFPFFRATFYRWAQMWPKVNPELTDAPIVLAVGDLHVENFGTWRDAEGRLVWGVNDFDEAAHLPYTSDLVRLTASAFLAIEADHLILEPVRAAELILAGYTAGMKAGGNAFVLEEGHPGLRAVAVGSLRDPIAFWKKMIDLPTQKAPVLDSARAALEDSLPARGMHYEFKKRVAGLGNLGKPRYVAVVDWNGGHIARETKALVPSACVWAKDSNETAPEIFYQAIVDRSVRCCDPFVKLSGHWIVRRLGPYCSRINMEALPQQTDAEEIFHSMGWETANIHLGSREQISDIRRDLRKRKSGWLTDAAARMAKSTQDDWRVWCKG
jgi:hypothetical protein